MEPTNLKQSACCPTIRYSINELLEYRSSLSYVICPIDRFTLVAWAEGLLDKVIDLSLSYYPYIFKKKKRPFPIKSSLVVNFVYRLATMCRRN